MMNDMSEEEYISTLSQQKHMYEWCLINIGNFSEKDAKIESNRFYAYEPPTEESQIDSPAKTQYNGQRQIAIGG